MKVIVTGGSGFIGTNVLELLRSFGYEVMSLDIKEPQNKKHKECFTKVDILDYNSLLHTFIDFYPKYVVHLAARTDLLEKKNIKGYSANIKGVENIVRVVSQLTFVERCIFTSTKLVCPTDYTPKDDNDYCPNTLYGESKVIGEQITKNSYALPADWCIVRPTSIWGPWSMMPHIPYGKFFRMIAQGIYFHPGKVNPPKSFGYVGNTAFQIKKLLEAPREQIYKKVFYLSDYDIFTIKDWADVISMKLKNKKVHTIPEPLVRLFAWGGNILKFLGIKEPPFSTVRLKNMRADTSLISLEDLKFITGPLPYTMEQGVEETIEWLKKQKFIEH